MPDSDIRWRQRLQNYSRALALLQSALKQGPDVLNDLEKEGAVRRFEYTVELAWKSLKDYLEFSGIELLSVTPKSVVKAAFSARLLTDGQLLINPREFSAKSAKKPSPRSNAATPESGTPACTARRPSTTAADGCPVPRGTVALAQ